MTEVKCDYITKKEVSEMILQAERRIAININELRQRSTTDFISSQIASTSGAVDRMGSDIKQIELKIPNIKDNVLMVDTKITQLENKLAKIDKNKVVQVPYIDDGALKALYEKCDGLTHSVVADKVNMGVQNVGLYFNNKNKSQEGRRKIHKFLTDHINASI